MDIFDYYVTRRQTDIRALFVRNNLRIEELKRHSAVEASGPEMLTLSGRRISNIEYARTAAQDLANRFNSAALGISRGAEYPGYPYK